MDIHLIDGRVVSAHWLGLLLSDRSFRLSTILNLNLQSPPAAVEKLLLVGIALIFMISQSKPSTRRAPAALPPLTRRGIFSTLAPQDLECTFAIMIATFSEES